MNTQIILPPPIVLPAGQLGYMYGIRLAHPVPNTGDHLGKLGKTKRKQPKFRLRDYIEHSGCLQNLFALWFGLFSVVEDIEDHNKSQYRNKRLLLLDDNLEWFDPAARVSNQDMIDMVETRVRAKGYQDEIFRVKAEHLPYTHRSNYKDILKDPNKYLERI